MITHISRGDAFSQSLHRLLNDFLKAEIGAVAANANFVPHAGHCF